MTSMFSITTPVPSGIRSALRKGNPPGASKREIVRLSRLPTPKRILGQSAIAPGLDEGFAVGFVFQRRHTECRRRRPASHPSRDRPRADAKLTSKRRQKRCWNRFKRDGPVIKKFNELFIGLESAGQDA